MDFRELSLIPQLQENLRKAGFVTLTKIQEEAIPNALKGYDITGLAQTGTGKTLAFLVPSIHFLLTESPQGGAFILVLAPTRELVLQIAGEARKLLQDTTYKVAEIIGGTDYKGQEDVLSENPGILVATPGRLIDFVKSRNLDLSYVKILIIDEADRMFDMGFISDLKYIFNKTKERRQTLLFSATLSHEIIRLASRYLKDPVEIQIDPEKIISERIEQKLYHLGREEKLSYLVNLILSDPVEGLGIIFTNYKSNIPLIVRTLHQFGIPAAGLSSDLDQKKRIRFLRDFRSGKYKFMVATDVASRGIDVANIDIVYNYDLPSDTENYVHRIGRTARAGKMGRSISFCSESDYPELERIEKYLRIRIPVEQVQEEFLQFPKGDFQPFLPENPRLFRSAPSKPSLGEVGKKQGSNFREPKEHRSTRKLEKPSRRSSQSSGKQSFPPKSGAIRKKHRNEPISQRSRQSQTNLKKNRRNLFDIEEVRLQEREIEKKSIWKRIKSLFGF